MFILTEEKILADMVQDESNVMHNNEKGLLISAILFTSVTFLFIVGVDLGDEGVPAALAYLGAIDIVLICAFVLIHIHNKKKHSHPDIRITEDIVIDREHYIKGRDLFKTYRLTGMSGHYYESKEPFYDYKPLEPLFVATLYDWNKPVCRKLYPQNICRAAENLKITKEDLPSLEDTDALVKRISLLHLGGYTDPEGKIHRAVPCYPMVHKCPSCGKWLPGGNTPERICGHCGEKYTLKVIDVMNEKEWYQTDFGKMPLTIN